MKAEWRFKLSMSQSNPVLTEVNNPATYLIPNLFCASLPVMATDSPPTECGEKTKCGGMGKKKKRLSV